MDCTLSHMLAHMLVCMLRHTPDHLSDQGLPVSRMGSGFDHTRCLVRRDFNTARACSSPRPTVSLTLALRLRWFLRLPPPPLIRAEGLGVWTDWSGNKHAGEYQGGRKHGSGVLSFVPETRSDISAVYAGGLLVGGLWFVGPP